MKKKQFFKPFFMFLFLVISANGYCQTNFNLSDIYLMSRSIPGVGEGVVKLNLSAGTRTTLTRFSKPIVGNITYDPSREMLITVLQQDGIIGVKPNGEKVSIANPTQSRLVTARGDGLIYLYTGIGFFYIDSANNSHLLIGLSSTAINIDGQPVTIEEIFFHKETNSLMVAGSFFVGAEESIFVRQILLNSSGTKVKKVDKVLTVDVSNGSEQVVGISYGPEIKFLGIPTGQRKLFLCVDTNNNNREPRMIDFNPFTMSGLSDFAQNGSYAGAAASDAGIFSIFKGYAIILNTLTNDIRKFEESKDGNGMVLIQGVSGNGCCERARFIEIIDVSSFIIDSDGDGLADAEEDLNGNCIWEPLMGETNFEDADSDKDGLLDLWEVKGLDLDNDGEAELNIDLPPFNANPLHKDIFIEIDWMESNGHSHKPCPESLQDVIDAFKTADINNPDNEEGITIHFDDGNLGGGNSLEHFDICNFEAQTTCDDIFSFENFYDFKSANFATHRNLIFHYAIFAHSVKTTINNFGGCELSTTSGRGEIFGNDFIVSIKEACSIKNKKMIAGTIMHELGHNLGLKHGGSDSINFKPNYLSVMNYNYQLHGIPPNGDLSYSNEKLSTLLETSLLETSGIEKPYKIKFSPDNSDECIFSKPSLTPDRFGIDWDGVGGISNNLTTANINNCDGNSPEDEPLFGANDWDLIRLDFQNSTDFQDGAIINLSNETLDSLSALQVNINPIANAGNDTTIIESNNNASIKLNGSLSNDPDWGDLIYSWIGPFPEGNGMVNGISPTITLPLGESLIQLTVNDGLEDSEPDTIKITIKKDCDAVIILGNVVPASCNQINGMINSVAFSFPNAEEPITFEWSNGVKGTIPPDLVPIGNLASGNYSITITEGSGCSATASIEVPSDCPYDCPDSMLNINDPCNDHNPNTSNDQIQPNCTCQGTPNNTGGPANCQNLQFNGTNGQIKVSGLTAAREKIEILGRNTDWQVVLICENDCSAPHLIPNLQAGTYKVKVQMYGDDGSYCYYEEEVTVTESTCPDSDQDGTCDEQDICNGQPEPGSLCDDGDDDTQNDRIQADCSCKGERNGNTGGEANCTTLTFLGEAGQIRVSNLTGQHQKIEIIGRETDWQIVGICDRNCLNPQIINNLKAGEYKVKVQLYGSDNSYCYHEETVIVPEMNCPDSDGDGTCDEVDICAGKPEPGTPCDDGDSNTHNDKIQADCSCKGKMDNTGDPCKNFQLSLANGNLSVANLTAPIEIIDLFSEDWQLIYNCQADCPEPTIIDGLARGRYHIIIKSYTVNWSFICRKNITFKITDFGVEIENESRSINRADRAFIYPNPATDEVTIQLKDFYSYGQLRIMNYLGKETHLQALDKLTNESIKINSKSWANGIYLVQIKLENRPLITKKLIINRLY